MDADAHQQAVAQLRELAETVIDQLGRVSPNPLGFDRASVEWVEGFIERERARRDPGAGVPEGLVNTLGAFLGECIIATAGGEWAWDDGQRDWAVHLRSGMRAFPFVKVQKQFTEGLAAGQSILGFFDVTVDLVATGRLGSGG